MCKAYREADFDSTAQQFRHFIRDSNGSAVQMHVWTVKDRRGNISPVAFSYVYEEDPKAIWRAPTTSWQKKVVCQ